MLPCNTTGTVTVVLPVTHVTLPIFSPLAPFFSVVVVIFAVIGVFDHVNTDASLPRTMLALAPHGVEYDPTT